MKRPRKWDLVVVGGGPSGLLAAGRAAESGREVLLIEKNAGLGRKLLITGGGRCNLTNAEPDIRVLAEHYKSARQALLSPFSKFSPMDVLAWFEHRGLASKIEANQRAFPASDRAQSVLDVLRTFATEKGVHFDMGTTVLGLDWFATETQKQIRAIRTSSEDYEAKYFILATGGTSHPDTGSTGDGFRWLNELGLRVRFPEPSLVPMAVKEAWISDLSGLSFSDVGLIAECAGETLEMRRGKLLFTHFGVSGPVALNFASEVARWRAKTARCGELNLAVDFFPDQVLGDLDRELLSSFTSGPARKLKNALPGVVPPRLTPKILSQANVDPECSVAQLTRDQRLRVAQSMKRFRLTFRRLMDSSRAVVSSGGLHIDEIDWRTMAVKRVPNLSVIGDLLDINRPSGGFSLQLCWSTAWVAGSGVNSGVSRSAVVP